MAKEPKASGTVKVRMLVPMASEKNDRNAGDTPEIGAEEAQRLIDRGFAEPFKAARGKSASDAGEE